MEVIVAILAIIVLVKLHSIYKAKRRKEYLLGKYHDDALVGRLIKSIIWEGMTEEQLYDSWGQPTAKEQKVYKTKTKETFKYGQTGKNRFRSRVIVESGTVVGWTQK